MRGQAGLRAAAVPRGHRVRSRLPAPAARRLPWRVRDHGARRQGLRGEAVRLVAAALAAAALGASAATPDARLVEDGRRVYNFRCYYCHGYSGDAKTLAATMLPLRPRAFVEFTAEEMPPLRIERAVRHGLPGSAMKSFAGALTGREIAAVVAFVHDEFVVRRAPNTRYHTPENGWPDHQRYSAAFPFALGRIPLDAPEASLGEVERAGRRLYLGTCITCHDRAAVRDPGPAWERAASR
ncbi:MAG: cytochrome c [Betaproteobacteria bacterium]|nr:cytochrome c [Betaproteobacteria bacterium]